MIMTAKKRKFTVEEFFKQASIGITPLRKFQGNQLLSGESEKTQAMIGHSQLPAGLEKENLSISVTMNHFKFFPLILLANQLTFN